MGRPCSPYVQWDRGPRGRKVTTQVIWVTLGRQAADRPGMTSSVADVSATEAAHEHLTTKAPCLICMTTLALDDERSRVGVVRWSIASILGLRMGTAVGFECPNGHSSSDDPELLRAFPRRRFW
jgi:hypothetical protein